MVVVACLTDSFNRVSNCTRKLTEALFNFVTRFTGLASEYLMQAGSPPNSKVGEVLAITILNNANLGETMISSAKIQLINAAGSPKLR